MARKKAEGKVTKADAVRAALAEGLQKPAEGVPYIKEKFGLDVTNQQFSTYKSLAGKKTKEKPEGGVDPVGVRAKPEGGINPIGLSHPVKAASNGIPNVATSIEALKVLCDQLGVDQVVAIAQLFRK